MIHTSKDGVKNSKLCTSLCSGESWYTCAFDSYLITFITISVSEDNLKRKGSVIPKKDLGLNAAVKETGKEVFASSITLFLYGVWVYVHFQGKQLSHVLRLPLFPIMVNS